MEQMDSNGADYLRVKLEIKNILELRLSQESELFEAFNRISTGNSPLDGDKDTYKPKTVAALINRDPVISKAFFEAVRELKLHRGTSEDFQLDARIAWDNGELEEAVMLYSFAIELDPRNGMAFMNRGDVQIEIGNFEDGILDLLEARAIDSELPTLHAELFQIMSPDIRELTRQKMIERRKLEK